MDSIEVLLASTAIRDGRVQIQGPDLVGLFGMVTVNEVCCKLGTALNEGFSICGDDNHLDGEQNCG